MAKRLVICGATGFIGHNLAARFAADADYETIGIYYKVPSFELPNLKWIKADLRSEADVHRAIEGADIVIQAAATTSGAKDIVSRPYIHVTDNALMNSLLLRAAYENSVGRFVFFSCTVMYPSSARALKETDFDANAEIFRNYFGVGWTKVYIEKMCEFHARLGRTKHTVIRHSNIYGPHDKFDLERSHVFGATMTKVLTATKGPIVVWGSGEEKRDLLYVDDLVDFVQLAIAEQDNDFGLYNVGLGRAIAVRDLVQEIVCASGRDIAVEHDHKKPTLKTSLFLDCDLARQAFGWQPATPLALGIEKTMQWYRENILAH
jgi:GDP-L-fucose synthase